LILVDGSANRLGGRRWRRRQIGDEAPDVDRASARLFFHVIQALTNSVSPTPIRPFDGGLFATICDGSPGTRASAFPISAATLAALFNEELGAVLQVPRVRPTASSAH
jgi:phosphoribosylformylglycinamidine synthase